MNQSEIQRLERMERAARRELRMYKVGKHNIIIQDLERTRLQTEVLRAIGVVDNNDVALALYIEVDMAVIIQLHVSSTIDPLQWVWSFCILAAILVHKVIGRIVLFCTFEDSCIVFNYVVI